jgi:hypothetical protein
VELLREITALGERMGGTETAEETKQGNHDPEEPISEGEWMGRDTTLTVADRGQIIGG